MRSFFSQLWMWLKQLYAAVIEKLGGTPKPGTPGEPDEPDPIEIVDYYGCPNSKRARQLQLSRKLYR